jgi:hypothetical protein
MSFLPLGKPALQAQDRAMDALDALSTERPILSSRLHRGRATAEAAPAPDAVARAEALVSQLPVLVRGGWTPAVSLDPHDALLRMRTAVLESAARDRPLVPPAAEAVAILTEVLARGDGSLPALRAAARLVAYLELRARFG